MSGAGATRARGANRLERLLPTPAQRKILLRGLGVAVALLAIVLLVRYATKVDWEGVRRALRGYSASQIALALGFVALSHCAYAGYDLVSRAYTKHALSKRLTYSVALVGFAFNLNVGAMLGGAVSKLRMYTSLGLGKAVVAKILALTITTNWLGYALLAGVVFVARPIALPGDWPLGGRALQAIGVLLLGVALAYLLLCAFAVRRSYAIRGHTLLLPSMQLALCQFGLALVNWASVGAVLYVLFGAQVPYFTVLGVLFLAVIATLIVRVPAGVGPLDAVFLALLTRELPHSTVIAALLAYRALYYLTPLALAIPGYFLIERHAAKRA